MGEAMGEMTGRLIREYTPFSIKSQIFFHCVIYRLANPEKIGQNLKSVLNWLHPLC